MEIKVIFYKDIRLTRDWKYNKNLRNVLSTVLLDTIMNMNPSGKSRKNGISAREKTYEYLKSNILSGHFIPGERLAEEHLAEELGVSRTPVREALHKLEQEGLIEPLESRGFRVPHDSPEEIEDLFDIRTVLEGYTLKIICERITDEQIGDARGDHREGG